MKNKITKKITAFFVATVMIFSSSPGVVFADILQNVDGDDGTVVFSGFAVQIKDNIGGGEFVIHDDWGGDQGVVVMNDVYAVSGFTVDHGDVAFNGTATDFVWKGDNDLPVKEGYELPIEDGQYFCLADKRISGFCDAVRNACGTTDPGDACSRSIGKVYDEKMKSILQAELDSKISDLGLDKDKANEAIEDCGGDLICINKVLDGLTNESSYAIGADDVSDSINSTNFDAGALNGSDNDPSGINNKQQGPKVDVSFSAEGAMLPGVKVKAVATPSFFNNVSGLNSLYYTWYLKRKGCEENKNGPIDESCNFDGDDDIDANDWKIAASRIIVSGEYDANETDEDGNPVANYVDKFDDKSAGYEAFPSPKDDWEINSGEENNDEDAPNCYVQDSKSGLIYELRETKSSFDNSCPINYHRACVSDQQADCNILNPAYDESNPDLAPRIIPNKFNACAVSNEKDYCSVTDVENFRSAVSCSNGTQSICVKDDNTDLEFKNNSSTVLGIIVGSKKENESYSDRICNAVAKPDLNNYIDNLFLSNANPLFTPEAEKCSSLRELMVNGKKDESGNVLIDGNLNLAPKCSFEKGANMCKHLFPKLPKTVVLDNGKEIDLSDDVSGDGKFTMDEKLFWGADPGKASTSGSGKDEEKIVGLGVDTFEWLYSLGDEVGVVVEGDSVLPTDHKDGEYKRMWAFSKGECKALEDIDGDRGFYEEISGNSKYGFLTTEIDLNRCLDENLLEPDADNFNGLSLQLSVTPENPINDPNGKGDVVSVSSNAMNVQNPDGLMYKWFMQKSQDGSRPPTDETNWIDITKDAIEGGSFSEQEREGLGKKDLAINLNLKDIEDNMNENSFNSVFYLRVRLKVIGTESDGSQPIQGQTLPIRVRQQENEMAVYPVTASSSGALSFNKGLSGQSLELCSREDEKIRCFVNKNQIVGLEVDSSSSSGNLSDFSWKVNGNDVLCKGNCTEKGNKMFVPILGNEGEAVDVVATGISKKNNVTESIEVSRHFVIGSSELQITSTDWDPIGSCSLNCLDNKSLCPKYLGQYKDLSGGGSPDCSYSVWETRSGGKIQLGTNGQTGFDWAIDGQIIPEFKDKNQIELSIDKPAGGSYNIGLSTHMLPGSTNQINNTRLALYKNWGVSPEDVTEENKSANIQINVVEGGPIIAKASQNNFAASLITHLPEQIMFLLKIVITSIIMLLSMSLLFAFMPESRELE